MAEVRISEEARIDPIDIRTIGTERFGDKAAERYLLDIRRSFDGLADHPMSGQARSEFERDIRALSRRPHRILYTVRGNIVLIVRVIHQARDVVAALRGE